MARLCPLFSGSKGNSYFIGSKAAGILVDAGRSAKQLELAMSHCNISPKAIQGILLTHEHSDHTSALRVFANRYALPVFASKGTLRAVSANLPDNLCRLATSGLQIAGMEITPFKTSHDCAEPFGYRIKTEEGRVVTISTDLGFVSEQVEEALTGSDVCVIESNHDIQMLKTGPYPLYLQNRILSNKGHLSNPDCAQLITRLAKRGTKRFLLAHLSEENNSRRVALETSLAALLKAGFIQGEDFILDAANPTNPEGKIILF